MKLYKSNPQNTLKTIYYKAIRITKNRLIKPFKATNPSIYYP